MFRNEVNILDDVKEIYDKEFTEALEEYNKGKRNDRQISDYLEYVSLENPKTTLGKLVSGAFKKFKEWWDRTKKSEVTEKARTSILEQLREARVRADQHNEQQIPKPHRTDLGMER